MCLEGPVTGELVFLIQLHCEDKRTLQAMLWKGFSKVWAAILVTKGLSKIKATKTPITSPDEWKALAAEMGATQHKLLLIVNKHAQEFLGTDTLS